MKRKTNISVQDNLGIRRTSNMIVSEKYNGFLSGDILDANAIVDLVKTVIDIYGSASGTGRLVTSEDIQNGTILIEDLSKEITDKLESTYKQDEELLMLNNSEAN